MHLAAGLVLVVAYLALSINSYLETQAFGRFSLGYGRLGPTEARIALIVLLAVVALGVEVSWLGLTLLDVVALGGAGVMVLALAARACGEPEGARRARALHRAVALFALVGLVRFREHADEQVGERDAHHERLLEGHQDARDAAGRRAAVRPQRVPSPKP